MANQSKPGGENPNLIFHQDGKFTTLPKGETPVPRHSRQLQAIKDLPHLISAADRAKLPLSKYREYDDNTREGTTLKLDLFDVIVALEWVPDDQDVETIKVALKLAAQLLYDVTDRYIAIGQVVVGGPELMSCADIQVFASNRLFPRAIVNGLNQPSKYQPIRIGRGLWSKNDRRALPWDDSLSPLPPPPQKPQRCHGTLVHEWAHYALGLKDQYIIRADNFVIPYHSLILQTIMADIDTNTELLSSRPNPTQISTISSVNGKRLYRLPIPDSEWDGLRKSFPSLAIPPGKQAIQNPPSEKPVPIFLRVGTVAAGAATVQKLWLSIPANAKKERLLISTSGRSANVDLCWVYVLKGNDITSPTELFAQGSFTDELEGFGLLGAEVGDFVVLIGSDSSHAYSPFVVWAQIEAEQPGTQNTRQAVMGSWHDVTPAAFPLIDLVALNASVVPPYEVDLRGAGTTNQDWTIIPFPLGEQRRNAITLSDRPNQPTAARPGPIIPELTVLDGHILLFAHDEARTELLISSYSIGGSPGGSGGPGHPNPLPAGSADGNAMVFFWDDQVGPLNYLNNYPRANKPNVVGQQYEAYKIITTTNVLQDVVLDGGGQRRSYIFSVTSNESFAGVDALFPTLVLYYDDKTRNDPSEQLVIGRYDPTIDRWVRLPDLNLYDKRNDFFIAAELNTNTAPALFGGTFGVERYAIFALPKPSQPNSDSR